MKATIAQFYLHQEFFYLLLVLAFLVLVTLLSIVYYQRQVKHKRVLGLGASRWAKPLTQAVPTFRDEALSLSPTLSRLELLWAHYLLWPLLGSGLMAFWVVLFRYPALFPFVSVLLVGMLGYVLYVVIGFFKPAPQLKLLPGQPVPGAACQLTWRFPRHPDRITRIKILLRATEKIYASGLFHHDEPVVNLFHEETLFEARRPDPVGEGVLDLDIPEFIPMSYKTKNQEILWEIHVEWATSFWPGLYRDFVLQVAPGPLMT